MDINELNKRLDLEDDKSVMEFINNAESNLLEGQNSNGETVIYAIEKGQGLRITTMQENGWIRTNDYDILDSELFREESYSK